MIAPPPDRTAPAGLHRPFAGYPVAVTASAAGWTYCGLEVVQLAAGQTIRRHWPDAECFVLPLAGSVDVSVSDTDSSAAATFELSGRDSVFAGPSDFCYVGRDSAFDVHAPGPALVALPSARCERRRSPRYGPAADVAVETRGAGPASRQVINFATPDAWPHAERLMCCELITPAGNWSSYPPHKHDITAPVTDEEIYFFRVEGDDGFGIHRTYTGPEHVAAGLAPLNETMTVRDGDVALVPYGYHGPSIAAPGYRLYYLNVLAGPGPIRSMEFADDPAHHWIRDSWAADGADGAGGGQRGRA